MLNQKQKPISGNKELNRSVYMTNCTSQFVKIIKTKPTLPVILFYYIMILTSYVVLILKLWSPQIALFSEIFVNVFLFCIIHLLMLILLQKQWEKNGET